MRKPFHLETQIKLLYQTTLNSVHEMSVIYTPSCDSEVLCYLQMTSVSPDFCFLVFFLGGVFCFVDFVTCVFPFGEQRWISLREIVAEGEGRV